MSPVNICVGAKVSGHFGTSADMFYRQFGTGAEVSVCTLVMPSVQHLKVWLMPTTRVPCSNAAKMQKPLKLAGVPLTNETISAASTPKFTIL